MVVVGAVFDLADGTGDGGDDGLYFVWQMGQEEGEGRACIFTFFFDKWGRGGEEGPYLVWKMG